MAYRKTRPARRAPARRARPARGGYSRSRAPARRSARTTVRAPRAGVLRIVLEQPQQQGVNAAPNGVLQAAVTPKRSQF